MLARFEGDNVLLGNLISTFFHDGPKLVAAARDAVARNDGLEFQRVTQDFAKQPRAFFGAMRPVKPRIWQSRLGIALTREHAGEALARLEEELERLRPALANLGKEVSTMKVLIAEDDSISRRMLEAFLVKWGYEVLVATEGEEAWGILQGNDAPRLAVLDWMMPGTRRH